MNLKFVFILIAGFNFAMAFNAADDVKGTQKFALHLFKSQFDSAENTVFSPFSIRVLLSILYQSATGATEEEIRNKAFLSEKSSTLTTQRDVYRSLWSNPSVKLANKIFLTKGGVLKSNFKTVVNEFDSEIEQVDFNKGPEVAGQMNDWVEEKTNGMIKDLIPSDSVEPDTALFLINTLYFKSKWESQFSADNIKDMDFTNYKHKTKKIPFMYQFGYYRYANLSSIGAEVIEMPYEDEANMDFWVVLPNPQSNIRRVLNSFTIETFNEFQTQSHDSGMDFFLPIFETESSMDVKEALVKYGIKSLFGSHELDMVENMQPQRVDEAKQKTKIIVNTEGTEASSATFSKAVPYTMWPSIVVNRPFFYMVVTRDNKIPLFVGHYSN